MHYSTRSFPLTTEEFNYLLPVFGINTRLHTSGENNHLIGSFDEVEDTLNRLKGLYDNYNDIPSIVVYNCCKLGTLKPFRTYITTK